jgi:putative tryptophan/tyrosine transport system substrate-binding protein
VWTFSLLRRRLAFFAMTAILATVITGHAQTPKKAYRVAWLTPTPAAEESPTLNAFRKELRQRGYMEGENITVERQTVEANSDRISAVMAELIRLNVDVVVAVTQPTVQAAQQATRSIPIVMVGVGDPVGTGLVAGLGRPGGNTTGLSGVSPELTVKRLELLREALPSVSKVAVLWNPTNPSNAPQLRDLEAAARTLKMQLQLLKVSAPRDLEGAFQAATRERAGALLTLDDLLIFKERRQIIGLAAKSRLPAIYGWDVFADAGGLMSYSPDFRDMGVRAAVFVDKILKGAKPGDLPVEQPTKFELVVNRRTARVLDLAIPASVLVRADRVIE